MMLNQKFRSAMKVRSKFRFNEIVVYQDDGQFPSLNNQQCRVLGIDRTLGYKLLIVEFTLYNGNSFTRSFQERRFKRVIQERTNSKNSFDGGNFSWQM